MGTDQSQKFVFTVDDSDTVKYAPVTLGPLVDGLRVIRSGLNSNDWVVVNGLMTIRPGAKVSPLRYRPNLDEYGCRLQPMKFPHFLSHFRLGVVDRHRAGRVAGC